MAMYIPAGSPVFAFLSKTSLVTQSVPALQSHKKYLQVIPPSHDRSVLKNLLYRVFE